MRLSTLIILYFLCHSLLVILAVFLDVQVHSILYESGHVCPDT
jgi:hypothetical protein